MTWHFEKNDEIKSIPDIDSMLQEDIITICKSCFKELMRRISDYDQTLLESNCRKLEAIAMNNQEQYLANPEDEETVRREMREKCIGKFEMSDVGAFFAKNVNPALNTFALSGPEAIDKNRFEIDISRNPSSHEGVHDGLPCSGFSLDFASLQLIGSSTTTYTPCHPP